MRHYLTFNKKLATNNLKLSFWFDNKNTLIMNKYMLIIAFLSSILSVSLGQNLNKELLNEVLFHADIMTNAEMSKHREHSMNKFNETFLLLLKETESVKYPFDELKWISKVSPDDKSFRIFTWEVMVSEDDYRYFGIIQNSEGNLFELMDDFRNAEDLATEEFNQDTWLGMYYYNIMEVKEGSKDKYYLLFGLNKWNTAENIKIIDVLFFTKEGKPFFGKPVFKTKHPDGTEIIYNRLLTRYASDAKVSLNYNPGMEMIITDHLVRRMSRMPGQAETMVPDGSYIAYQYKNKFWNRIDKLENEIMDSAPRPKPILDSRQNRGIMGDDRPKRTTKNKNK